jgi:uncharacterized membrane protein
VHLLHPAAVHFTVAFIVAGGTLEAFARLAGAERVVRWAEVLLWAGLASTVPTIVTGYLAANVLTVDDAGAAAMAAHERNGWIVVLLLLVAQFWKAWCGGLTTRTASQSYAVLLLVVVAFTIYSAWLGGSMVYVQGIGVR